MKSETPLRVGREITADDVQEMGFIAGRKLQDGRWLAVAPMTFGKGRLYFDLDRAGAEACYCYTSIAEACAAMKSFDPEKDEEPQGWFKDPMNNRIRPDGDASRETIGYPPPDENPKGKTK